MPRTRPSRSNPNAILVWLGLACCVVRPPALAQTIQNEGRMDQVIQFSRSLQALSARVSPSVVQVLVTRYGTREENDRSGAVVSRQRNLGSGVIVDPDGYIMTNAHVVEGAQQIRVRLTSKGQQTVPSVVAESYAPPQNATLVGIFKEGDLALLKIDAAALPALPFADYGSLRQGEVVFAFGSPAGLQNSMSMGVVSSIARQLDPDSPFLYIQTDAPINPGDSGGPLVNAASEIVGLDTFIVTESGGSEGIGFAIPSPMVQWVFGQLRKYGHVHRPVIGAGLQTITPTLAAALKLPSDSGVVVSDVVPGGPAEKAGLKLGDVLLSVDAMQLNNVAAMMGVTFQHGSDQHMKLEVLRGSEHLSFDIKPAQEQHEPDRLADLPDPTESLIPRLGILGITVDKRIAAVLGDLRRPSGVIVAARVENPGGLNTGLQAGDVIHEINGNFVLSAEALQSAARQLKPGDPVALLIERGGKLLYAAFQME
jgi:serine protease Do